MPNPVGHCLASLVAVALLDLALGQPPLGPPTFVGAIVAVGVEATNEPGRPHDRAWALHRGVAVAWAPGVLALAGLLPPSMALALVLSPSLVLALAVGLDALFRPLADRGSLPHILLHGLCLALLLGLLIP